jgi:transposase
MLSIQKQQVVQEEIDKIIALTKPYPMTNRLALKIYRAYGTDSIKRLTQNPYELARDVFGIGEQTAAQITKAIEAKLGTTFSPNIITKSKTTKYRNCGPGNGKLSPQNLAHLKQKLQVSPAQALPGDWVLHNANAWTISDLKRAIQLWFGVTWAHDSSYRNLFKKCSFVYLRKEKIFIRVSMASLNGHSPL